MRICTSSRELHALSVANEILIYSIALDCGFENRLYRYAAVIVKNIL